MGVSRIIESESFELTCDACGDVIQTGSDEDTGWVSWFVDEDRTVQAFHVTHHNAWTAVKMDADCGLMCADRIERRYPDLDLRDHHMHTFVAQHAMPRLLGLIRDYTWPVGSTADALVEFFRVAPLIALPNKRASGGRPIDRSKLIATLDHIESQILSLAMRAADAAAAGDHASRASAICKIASICSAAAPIVERLK